jgi:hypothetical protein
MNPIEASGKLSSTCHLASCLVFWPWSQRWNVPKLQGLTEFHSISTRKSRLLSYYLSRILVLFSGHSERPFVWPVGSFGLPDNAGEHISSGNKTGIAHYFCRSRNDWMLEFSEWRLFCIQNKATVPAYLYILWQYLSNLKQVLELFYLALTGVVLNVFIMCWCDNLRSITLHFI